MLKNSIIDRLIIIDIALIIAALCFANYSDFDVKLQNYFFNFETKNWLIDANEPVARFIFYQLPKILLGFGIFGALALAIYGFKNKNTFYYQNRHKFLLVFLGFSLIPLIVGNIKKFTDIYCPNQLAIYSGEYPHYHIFQKYDADFEKLRQTISPHGELQYGKKNRGLCFPAGHAVTGFALMILFFALEKKSARYLALLVSVVLGWVLGVYQMAKGAHFFSHNLVSMLLCFLVAAIIARVYYGYTAKKAMN